VPVGEKRDENGWDKMEMVLATSTCNQMRLVDKHRARAREKIAWG
jgi:hypothetical protein